MHEPTAMHANRLSSDGSSLRSAVVAIGLVLLAASLAGCETPDEAEQRRAGQNQVEHAVLWRGFAHEWGYNHRLNRLGNYVTMAGCHTSQANRHTEVNRMCTGQAVHAAATGTGDDKGAFSSHFSTLRSDAITFTEGNVSLRFTGKEEQLLTDEAVLELSLEEPLSTNETHIVFLNGFDLRTRPGSKAKKLRRIHFSVDRQPSVDAGDELLTFRVRGELNANCDSVECKTQKNRVRYIADLRWLMVSADDLPTARKSIRRGYRWDKKNELTRDRLDTPPEISLTGQAGISSAAVGWTEFGVEVAGYRRKSGRTTDRDHWFVEWSMYLPVGEYAPDTGTYQLQPDLFFKQWNRETKRRRMSIAKRGEVTLTGEVTMIQHRDLRVEHRSVEGEVEWRGSSAAAHTEKAVKRKTFTF